MPKKKKNQTHEGIPQTENVFSEGAAAMAAAQTAAQEAAVTVVATAEASSQTISDETAELIRATLKILIAQRRLYGLATTITSVVKSITRALGKYVDKIPAAVIREFVKKELESMGYKIIVALVEYSGVRFEAEVVVLYKSFDELVDMVKAGRLDTLRAVIMNDGIDPIFDKMAKA